MTQGEKAELYDHMLEVAKAAGFDCLTAAIVAGSKYEACRGDISWAVKARVELRDAQAAWDLARARADEQGEKP